MRKINHNYIVALVITFSLIIAVQTIYHRLSFEASFSNVEIALEYGDLLELAELTGQNPLVMLEEFRLSGLTTLVLLDDHAINPDADLLVYLRLTKMVTAVQLTNLPEYHEIGIVEVLAVAAQIPNLNMVFFAGYEALGWSEFLHQVASALSFINIPVGYVEMLGEQKGLDQIMHMHGYSMIRTYPGYPYSDLTDMVRAVIERNVRFLFLKPFKNMGIIDEATGVLLTTEAADAIVIAWISEMRDSINAAGLPLGAAERLPIISLNPISELYLQLGIVAAALLLFYIMLPQFRYKKTVIYLLLLLHIVAVVFYSYGYIPRDIMRDLYALLGAVVFPALGLIMARNRLFGNATILEEPDQFYDDMIYGVPEVTHAESPKPMPNVDMLKYGIRTLLESSTITIIGAVIVNAMLSDIIFISGWRFFRGVKFALITPPILVALHVIWQEIPKDYRFELATINFKRVITCLLAFGIGFIYLLRSGNDTATISGLENILRVNLESFFGIRPRFKEFILGHPAAFLLGLHFKYSELRVTLFAIAAIGQASIFNSFMHLHTPILLSVRRTLWGLALGEVLGIIAFLLIALGCLIKYRIMTRGIEIDD
jgi:hypothetical protein